MMSTSFGALTSDHFVARVRAVFSAVVHHRKSSIMVWACVSSSASPLSTVAAPEMRPKGRDGNVDGRANRGNLKLYRRFPELLDAARAHGAAIADEGSRLAIPLRIHPVERILQHR